MAPGGQVARLLANRGSGWSALLRVELQRYLPWWLQELIQESVDPIPVAELKDEHVDFSGRGCAKWETEYSKENEKIQVYNSACFNADGTAKNLFTRSVSVKFGDYQSFGDKRIARSLTVWPGSPADVKGVVTGEAGAQRFTFRGT